MSGLAGAQSRALAFLMRAGPVSGSPSSVSQLHVTGLEGGAAHAAAFNLAHARAAAVHVSPTGDYSALLLDEWLAEYQRERSRFASVSLFCEIKLRELIEVHTRPSAPRALCTTRTAQWRRSSHVLNVIVCVVLAPLRSCRSSLCCLVCS
jgi:hypothetical protein